MDSVVEKLSGQDLRSIGKADEVAKEVISNPALFNDVFYAMKNGNPVIRMRAADAAEKVSRKNPLLLAPYKKELINDMADIEQQEVRWHVALMFSYLQLDAQQKALVMDKLVSWIETSKSRIVQVNSLQALFSLGRHDMAYANMIKSVLEKANNSGSPAVAARCKKLLKQLRGQQI